MVTYSVSAETVYNVARQLNVSLDLDEVLGNVLRLTVEAIGAERGSLFLLDERGRVTRQILARPDQSPEVSRRNVRKVMREGLAGWVYRHQYGALTLDNRKDNRWVRLPDDEEIIGSAVVVPLLYQERVNGLLALHHRQIGFFDESHLALAAGIGGQAAIALENARLFTKVKNERETLLTLINSMPNPVLVVDQANHIQRFNLAARAALSVVQINTPLATIEGGSELERALVDLDQRPENNIEVSWPDGRFFRVSTNHVPEVGTVVALDDITYLKELDAMKTQFVETVSHDLKNPLSVITGFIRLMEMDTALSDDSKSSLEGIKQSTEHMRVLITDLLDLARIEAGMGGDVQAEDFAQIILEVLPEFELQLSKKSMTLTTDVPFGSVPVLGNQLRLSQVVTNLVSNAVKYTPVGGHVTVALSREAAEVRLSVSDNGPGISPAGQKQLFQKFYRVPEIHHKTGVHGTGLGLSIVKAIIEGYGGRVWVQSQVGLGSTFSCVLPAYRVDHNA